MNREFQLLPLTVKHAGLLSNIHASVEHPWNKPWSEHSYSDLLMQPSIKGYAFFKKEKVISFILVQYDKMDCDVVEMEVLYLATVAAYRNQGLATKLFQEILHITKAKKIFLEVCKKNDGAIKMYKKMGLSEISIRKNYYKGKNNLYYHASVLVKNF